MDTVWVEDSEVGLGFWVCVHVRDEHDPNLCIFVFLIFLKVDKLLLLYFIFLFLFY